MLVASCTLHSLLEASYKVCVLVKGLSKQSAAAVRCQTAETACGLPASTLRRSDLVTGPTSAYRRGMSVIR